MRIGPLQREGKNFFLSSAEGSKIGKEGMKMLPKVKKSQHGCGRWAPQPNLTPPCSDFACGGLKDNWNVNRKTTARGGHRNAHVGRDIETHS